MVMVHKCLRWLGSVTVVRQDAFKQGQTDVTRLHTNKQNCCSKFNTRVRNQTNITAEVIDHGSSQFNLTVSPNCVLEM